MSKWENIAGKDRFTLTDLEGNEIVTTDPLKVISEMWTKFWPVPPIGKCSKAFKELPYGDELLLEDTGIIVRKHYRIV